MTGTIQRVSLAAIPHSTGNRFGTGKLEPLVQAVLDLGQNESLRVIGQTRNDVRRVAERVCYLLRDRGYGCRHRTAWLADAMDDANRWAAYIWLCGDMRSVAPSRQRV